MAVVLKQGTEEILDGATDRSDIIALFNVRSRGDWECQHKFSSGSSEVEDLRFSRDGSHLIVWDSPMQCAIQVLQVNFSGARLIRYVQQVAFF